MVAAPNHRIWQNATAGGTDTLACSTTDPMVTVQTSGGAAATANLSVLLLSGFSALN